MGNVPLHAWKHKEASLGSGRDVHEHGALAAPEMGKGKKGCDGKGTTAMSCTYACISGLA